jgi:hypothetical protein
VGWVGWVGWGGKNFSVNAIKKSPNRRQTTLPLITADGAPFFSVKRIKIFYVT